MYKSPFDKKRYTLWNFTKGKQSTADLEDGESRAIHRQFFLDRIATLTAIEARKQGNDLQWWFHGFKRKTISGYSAIDLRKARDALVESPRGDRPIVNGSLGLPKGSIAALVDPSKKVDILTVKKAIFEAFRGRLFEELEDPEFSSLILNSAHDLTQ